MWCRQQVSINLNALLLLGALLTATSALLTAASALLAAASSPSPSPSNACRVSTKGGCRTVCVCFCCAWPILQQLQGAHTAVRVLPKPP